MGSFSWRRPDPRQLVESAKHVVEEPVALDPVTPSGVPLPVANTRGSGMAARNAFGHFAEDAGGVSVGRDGVTTSGGGASTTVGRGGYTNVAHQEGRLGNVGFTHGGSTHIGRDGVHLDEDTSIRGGGSGVTVGTSGVHGNLGNTGLSVDRDGVTTSGGGASTTVGRGGYTNVSHQEGNVGGVQFTHGGSTHIGRDGVHYDESSSIGVGGRTVSVGTDARTAFGHFAEDTSDAGAGAVESGNFALQEAEAAQREAEEAARAAQEEAEREAEAALRAAEEAERAAEEEARNAADNAGSAAEDTGNAVVDVVTNNGNGWW